MSLAAYLPEYSPKVQNHHRHAVIFPFMSKGHTIPLLHLARLLLTRHLAAVTLITTPSNRPFIAASLQGTAAAIVDLPFPENVPFLPTDVQSTDKLPSISQYFRLANATKLMRPDFEDALRVMQPRPSFIISDGFLGWTYDAAASLGIPRIVFYGMSNFAMAVTRAVMQSLHEFSQGGIGLDVAKLSSNESFTPRAFPRLNFTLGDFDPIVVNPRPGEPHFDFIIEQITSTSRSHALLANSFYDLEPTFVDYWNQTFRPKACCVGPLSSAVHPQNNNCLNFNPTQQYMKWLDEKLAQGKSVVYVAFGTQAEISPEQESEIGKGLEDSGVNYMWVVRDNERNKSEYYEKGLGLGLVVRGWVDQNEVLGHASVEGFLSHCGWNSVMDAMCAGVPIAAFPMMAEQFLNVRMVVEEVRVGLRVETEDGTVRGFVRKEGLGKTVRELMEGPKGEDVRRRARKLAESGRNATEEGGSSWEALELMVKDACGEKS